VFDVYVEGVRGNKALVTGATFPARGKWLRIENLSMR
jgi:hypothetical protein